MKHLYFFLLAFLSLAGPAPAQTLDPTLQPTTLLNHDEHVQVLALAAQADGKALVAGNFQVVGSALSNNVIRLNADRSRDLSFRPAPGANGAVSSLVALPDGKVLIAGAFTAYTGTATGPVARLLPTGELDASFQLPAALAGATVNALAVQADGKVLVGGAASAALPGGLVRLLPGGALDASFDVGAGAGSGGTVLALAVQPADGRIVVGGRFAGFGGRVSQSLVRLLPGGSPDPDFAASGFAASAIVYSVALYANGNVLAGGYTKASGSSYPTGLLARLLPTGAADPQFSTTIGYGSLVLRVRVDAASRALVGGFFSAVNSNGIYAYDNRTSVARLLPDGSLDPGFVPPTSKSYGYIKTPYYFDMLPQADGQMLLGGMLIEGGHYALSLFSPAGVPDNSFDLDLKWRGAVGTATPLASGKLLLTGSYTSLNGQVVSGQFQRLNADGSFDQNLTLPAGIGSVSSVFAQPDGRLYVVGYTTKCTGDCGGGQGTQTKTYRVYRVAADNTLDAGFTPVELGQGFNGIMGGGQAAASVQFVLPYANGDVLLAGTSVGTISNLPKPMLARYLPTGAAAPGFTAPTLPGTARLDQVLLQADGSVLLSYHLLNAGASQLVRMLPDGSLDPAFTVGSSPALPAGSTFVARLALPGGQALVVGNFTSFGGVAAPAGVVRLTSTGAADPAFQPAASLAPLVPLAALPDGRLLARANDQPGTARLVRLLPDGAADASFAPVTLSVAGYPVASWSLVLQPTDGKPVLYGDFEAVNGQSRTGLARLAEGVLATRGGLGAGATASLYPNPAHDRTTLALAGLPPAATRMQATLLDALGRVVARQPVAVAGGSGRAEWPTGSLPAGLYVLRLQAQGATGELLGELPAQRLSVR